jgi:hypothetical protein
MPALQACTRKKGKALIPAPNALLQGLVKVNEGIAAFIQKRDPREIAIPDQDATIWATATGDALFRDKNSFVKYKTKAPLLIRFTII